MKILFDHCVPKPIRSKFPEHEIRTAYQMGWESLKNGELLGAAEIEFEVLLTVDQNISHQQNMTERSIAIVILIVPDNTVTTLLPLIPELLTLLPTVKPGNIYYIGIPRI